MPTSRRSPPSRRSEGTRKLVLRPPRKQSSDDDRGSDEDQLKLAGFRVGDGLYGIDIMRIKEVIQAAPYPVRAVPHTPTIVEGVISLRGVVIPVIDLRRRFGAPTNAVEHRLNKLVIVSVRGRIVALKVDQITGELRLPGGSLRPSPSMLRPSTPGEPTRADADFFSGVCRSGDEMIFVVKLETLIDPTIGSLPLPPPPIAPPLAESPPEESS
jgi:purine-binding chemotaxis protein CheW